MALRNTGRRPAAGRARVRLVGQELESRQLLAAIVMSDQEQLLLELVNRARANPEAEAARFGIDLNQDLEPDEISPDPKQPLAPNQMLITAAGRHADDMLIREFFEHVNPDGDGPSERARAAGYPAGAGENIAWFGKPGFLERDEEVYRRHEALFLSEHHRTNMLNAGYREIGNGIRYGEFSRLNSIMVAESFGNRGGDYFITGVAYTDTEVKDDFYTIGESLGGVEVVAKRNSDGKTYSTTTGPSGGYALQVPFGVYVVTAQGSGIPKKMATTNVVMLGRNTKVDFNTRSAGLGSINGILFEDADGDGQRDVQEAILANRKVFIDADDDGVLDADETVAQTDAAGAYHFENLRPGNYVLRQELPQGWQTPEAVDDKLELELGRGQNAVDANFGSVIVNHVPVAQPDHYATESGRVLTMDVFANDTDSDGELVLDLTQIHIAPQHGELALNKTNGTIVYTPAEEFVGSDYFEYAVIDDGGLSSDPVRVTIDISPAVGNSWQNPAQPLDVNGDTFVSSLDALLVLNVINRGEAGR